MNNRDALIDELAGGLQPVEPVGQSLVPKITLWFCLSAFYVIAMTWVSGPLRPGAFEQLQSHPRFLLESLLGVLAIGAVAVTGFRSAIPGQTSRRAGLVALLLIALWLANYLVGFVSPALESGMLGKRGHCYLETLVLGLPPALLAVYLQRRFYPLNPVASAAAVGFAAGMMPALYMQIACMYEPGHILAWHILPGALVAPLVCLPVLLLHRRGQAGG